MPHKAGVPNPRRDLFIYNYVVSQFKLRDRKSAIQIAIESGYSAKSAKTTSYRLLGDEGVQARISALKQQFLGEYSEQAEQVLRELDIIATNDVRRIFKEVVEFEVVDSTGKTIGRTPDREQALAVARAGGGTIIEHRRSEMKDILEMGDEAKAIAGVEYIPQMDGSIKIKVRFWDKNKGLELLGKHHKLYTEQIEHKGQVAGSVAIVLPDNGKGPPPAENGKT